MPYIPSSPDLLYSLLPSSFITSMEPCSIPFFSAGRHVIGNTAFRYSQSRILHISSSHIDMLLCPHSYNLSQLEEWCRKRGLAENSVLAEISPVYQTCKLLQMNKTDVTEITSICSSLNPLQVGLGMRITWPQLWKEGELYVWV